MLQLEQEVLQLERSATAVVGGAATAVSLHKLSGVIHDGWKRGQGWNRTGIGDS